MLLSSFPSSTNVVTLPQFVNVLRLPGRVGGYGELTANMVCKIHNASI
jgi:hypothetical protein